MTYVTKEDIQSLTGLSDLEVEDDRLDRIITDAENLVDGCTGRSWSASDNDYSKIQTVACLFAASLIYEGLPSTPETQAKAHRYHEKAMLMLKAMRVLDSGPLKRV